MLVLGTAGKSDTCQNCEEIQYPFHILSFFILVVLIILISLISLMGLMGPIGLISPIVRHMSNSQVPPSSVSCTTASKPEPPEREGIGMVSTLSSIVMMPPL